ncbi:uncharacterized protein HKW66_Vig0258940 [Vigna angularis]|uniref:Transmembrane protein n=1 Tax=Phaseolus angularis TaxID=3914 RepID=A0A8T0KSB8_PHAAN|nr:uncharacterized protein HKW66_Vig0258940 [Vigna angularis]
MLLTMKNEVVWRCRLNSAMKVSLVLADLEEKEIHDGGFGTRLLVVVICVWFCCFRFMVARERERGSFRIGRRGGDPREMVVVALVVVR